MIEWSDEAIAAALRVWLRLSEVGEFRDVRWRETMRQALTAAVEAQNRPDVMGDALAKALIRATDLEIEAYRLKTEIKAADEMMLNQAKTIKRLQQENEKLRAALKPFVPDTAITDPALPDSRPIDVLVRVGDLRAARAALKETGD